VTSGRTAGGVATAAPMRVERALSAGLLCGPGGAAAHVLAGGTPPTVLALLLVTVAALTGAGLASARRLGPLALLGLAGGAQLVFHHAFGPAPAGGHAMHGGAMTSESTMVLAHLTVALAVAVVAGGLESSWWALARAAVVRLLPALPALPTPLPVVGRRPRTVGARTAVPCSADAPDVVGPRGPPHRRALAPLPA